MLTALLTNFLLYVDLPKHDRFQRNKDLQNRLSIKIRKPQRPREKVIFLVSLRVRHDIIVRFDSMVSETRKPASVLRRQLALKREISQDVKNRSEQIYYDM